MAFPWRLQPMLATLGELPGSDDGWSYEFKWDGYRALAGWDGKRFALTTRNGNDLTARYPELRDLGRALGAHEAVLDGELRYAGTTQALRAGRTELSGAGG